MAHLPTVSNFKTLQDIAKLQLEADPAAVESVLESESQEVALLGFQVRWVCQCGTRFPGWRQAMKRCGDCVLMPTEPLRMDANCI